MTNFRWIICALLFFATTVNYLDRQVLSLTWKDFIAPEFNWTDNDYGTITAVFSIIYALCNLFAGKFIDKLGTKKGYLWAIFIWSLGACLHAGCGVGTAALKSVGFVAMMGITASVWLFLACRAVLALGEAGNFPAAIKVTAEYFPKKDRAFATSIFNSGSSVGALAAPLTIPVIAKFWGWEMAFIVIGALGFVWMGFWVFYYKKPAENSRVNAAELEYINQDETRSSSTSTRMRQVRPNTVRTSNLTRKHRRYPMQRPSRCARRGRSSSAGSSPTACGGSSSSGRPATSATSSATRARPEWAWRSSSRSTRSSRSSRSTSARSRPTWSTSAG